MKISIERNKNKLIFDILYEPKDPDLLLPEIEALVSDSLNRLILESNLEEGKFCPLDKIELEFKVGCSKCDVCNQDDLFCDEYIYRGHIQCFKIARKRGCRLNANPYFIAIETENTSMIKWLKGYLSQDNELICAWAAQLGKLEILKWLRANGFPWDGETIGRAAEGGYLEIIKWAYDNGSPMNEITFKLAVNGGRLKILEWLKAHDCPWDATSTTKAARRGNLEVLKWLRANKCPWDENIYIKAAKKGHLDIIQWAWENGCPRNELACWTASAYGNLEVLKWLRANGFPWVDWACTLIAIKYNHFKTFKWILSNGGEWKNFFCGMDLTSEYLEWIEERGYPCDPSSYYIEDPEFNELVKELKGLDEFDF